MNFNNYYKILRIVALYSLSINSYTDNTIFSTSKILSWKSKSQRRLLLSRALYIYWEKWIVLIITKRSKFFQQSEVNHYSLVDIPNVWNTFYCLRLYVYVFFTILVIVSATILELSQFAHSNTCTRTNYYLKFFRRRQIYRKKAPMPRSKLNHNAP